MCRAYLRAALFNFSGSSPIGGGAYSRAALIRVNAVLRILLLSWFSGSCGSPILGSLNLVFVVVVVLRFSCSFMIYFPLIKIRQHFQSL